MKQRESFGEDLRVSVAEALFPPPEPTAKGKKGKVCSVLQLFLIVQHSNNTHIILGAASME